MKSTFQAKPFLKTAGSVCKYDVDKGPLAGIFEMDENRRHYLHEFMTGQRHAELSRTKRRLNAFLWIMILLLFACFVYLLVHE